MSGRAMGWRPPTLAACVIGTAVLAGSGPANAALIVQTPDTSFASSPATITLGTGSFIFSDIAGALPGNPPAAVSTTGSAMVTSILGGVADFEAGATIDQTKELYSFAAFPTPTVIPYSAADDFIGLDFDLDGSLHYGYAEVDGTELVSYAYQSLPNTGVVTGAAVPEPATFAVFGAGLIGLVAVKRRRRRVSLHSNTV